MTTWNLEPGCERPIMKERPMGKSPTVSMDEIISRLEALGAEVKIGKLRHAVYPADKSKPVCFIPVSLADGRDLTEVYRRLRKSGLHVENPIPATQETPAVNPSPAAMPPRTNGHQVSAPKIEPKRDAKLDEVSGALMEMLAQAESRIARLEERADANASIREKLEDEVRSLRERAGDAETEFGHLQDEVTAHRDRMDRFQKSLVSHQDRIRAVEQGVVPEPVNPHAEFDARILGFMQENPIKLTSSIIAANIGEKSQLIGKRLQAALVPQGLVEAFQDGPGTNKTYRIVQKEVMPDE